MNFFQYIFMIHNRFDIMWFDSSPDDFVLFWFSFLQEFRKVFLNDAPMFKFIIVIKVLMNQQPNGLQKSIFFPRWFI